MGTVECPYCGEEKEIDHTVEEYYDQEKTHQIQCGNCEKYFVFTTSISFFYSSEKADCLNDGNHYYVPTHTYPKAFTEMRCCMCDDTRELTNEERTSLGIETTEEYFKSLKDK